MQSSSIQEAVTPQLYSHCGTVVEASADGLVLESFDGITRNYQITDRTLLDGDFGFDSVLTSGEMVRVAAEVRQGFVVAVSVNRCRACRSQGGMRPVLYRVI